MFHRIVIAIDPDSDGFEHILEAGREVAQAFGSEVLVAHIRTVERPVAMVATAGKPGMAPPLSPMAYDDDVREAIDRAVRELVGSGLRATGRVESGKGSTARELLDIAADFRADLIVVGAQSSRIADVLLGGVAYRIVHLAECPVLLVR